MIIVAFIPGSRSTLVMRILQGLGAELIKARIKVNGVMQDVETERLETDLMGIGVNSADTPANLAVKILVFPALLKSKLGPNDRVIYLVRSPAGVHQSQEKRGIWQEHRMNHFRFSAHFDEWAQTAPCPILYLDTDKMVSEPLEQVRRIAEFTGLPGDTVAAAAMIDPAKSQVHFDAAEDKAAHFHRKHKAKC